MNKVVEEGDEENVKEEEFSLLGKKIDFKLLKFNIIRLLFKRLS